jgi:site-specific DNA recombinase
LVSCRKCGYALSRTSARTSAREIHYYRCLGSDAWRHLGGPVCDSRPTREDLPDQIVWQEVIHLIEDPTLIQAELDRRLDAARAAEPTKRRREALERELTRIGKSMERLLTAYQEDLLSLDELRHRVPEQKEERWLATGSTVSSAMPLRSGGRAAPAPPPRSHPLAERGLG